MSRNEKVKKIVDGDTFETASRKHPVRLANVEAPEKGEKGYAKAKRKLEGLIGGQVVTIRPMARDKYGRTVANVSVGETSVNLEMRY